MYLYCITKLSSTLFNQEVMQKDVIVHPHRHLSELTTVYWRETFDWIL